MDDTGKELGPSMIDSRSPTVTENLLIRKKNLERDLERVNHALDLLTSTPDIQKVLDSLSGLNLRL